MDKYLEERIAGLEARLNDWIAESRRQIDKSETALSERLERLNNIREEVVSDRVYYLRVDAYEVRHRELEARLKNVEDFVSNLRGRMWAGGITLTVAMSIITVAITIAVKYF